MKERKGFRKLHRKDGVWQWKKGRGSLILFSPMNEKYLIGEHQLYGVRPDDIERAYWKGYATGVRPKDIMKWIDENV